MLSIFSREMNLREALSHTPSPSCACAAAHTRSQRGGAQHEGEARQQEATEEGGEAATDTVAKKDDKEAIHLTTKLETLFPQKRQPARRAAPKGEKVEVYEGSTSRSTYVHGRNGIGAG